MRELGIALIAPTAAQVVEAVFVAAVLGGVAFALRTVGRSGLIAGVVVGTVVYLAMGRGGFALLVLFFAAGSAVTVLGCGKKRALHAAEGAGGARSAGSVVGKGLVPVACAILAWALDHPEWAVVAFVSALAAALADTVATEVGTLLGRRFWTVPRFRRVAAGTPGAVSIEGTLCGALAAAAVGAASAAVGLTGWSALWIVVLAAVVAGLVESVEGRILSGMVPPHVRKVIQNLDLTLTAAILGGVLRHVTA